MELCWENHGTKWFLFHVWFLEGRWENLGRTETVGGCWRQELLRYIVCEHFMHFLLIRSHIWDIVASLKFVWTQQILFDTPIQLPCNLNFWLVLGSPSKNLTSNDYVQNPVAPANLRSSEYIWLILVLFSLSYQWYRTRRWRKFPNGNL